MIELKPCPFCGDDKAFYVERRTKECFCMCGGCDTTNDTVHADSVSAAKEIAGRVWNDRPIEDALNARIDKLNARIDALETEIEGLNPYRNGYDPKEKKPDDCKSVIVEIEEGLVSGYYSEIDGRWFHSQGGYGQIYKPLWWWPLPEKRFAERVVN